MNQNNIVKNVTMEITLRCNLHCANCNRLVGYSTPENSDMTLDQVDLFIKHVKDRYQKTGVGLDHIWIMGGEALIHPQFNEIYCKVKDELQKTGIVNDLVLYTNGTLPIPPCVTKVDAGSINRKADDKKHSEMFVSPLDMKYSGIHNCGSAVSCGIVINAFGYFACGAGCSLVRLFHLPEEIKYEFPHTLEAFDFNKICPHCTHSSPHSKEYSVHRDPKSVKVTPTFSFALKRGSMKMKLFGQ